MKRFSLALGLGFAAVLVAQPPEVKPGPEHEILKSHVGRWTCKIKSQGQESEGTANYRMECGGLWLTSDFKGKVAGMDFHGKGFDSYDAASKKYKGVWVDSMSTKPMNLEGTYDAASKTLTQIGMAPGPDGKDVEHKMVTKFVDNDNFSFSMSMGGQEMMTIDYKRAPEQPRKGKGGKGKGKGNAPPPGDK